MHLRFTINAHLLDTSDLILVQQVYAVLDGYCHVKHLWIDSNHNINWGGEFWKSRHCHIVSCPHAINRVGRQKETSPCCSRSWSFPYMSYIHAVKFVGWVDPCSHVCRTSFRFDQRPIFIKYTDRRQDVLLANLM